MAEALNAAVRATKRARRIPPHARCADCHIANAVVLQRSGRQWRCYQCANARRGVSIDEAHHILGKDCSPVTVDINVNLHRILSDEQLAIPEEIKQKDPHNPIAWIIRLLCSIRGLCRALLDMLTAAIEWLRRLLAALEKEFGEQWPGKLDLPSVFV